MNIQLGLQRVSAVWWGLWGLLGLVIFGAGIFGQPQSLAHVGGGFCAMVVAYIAHRVTCWIVTGFFPEG